MKNEGSEPIGRAQLAEVPPRSPDGLELMPDAACYVLSPPFAGADLVAIGRYQSTIEGWGKSHPHRMWAVADGRLLPAWGMASVTHDKILADLGYTLVR